MKTISQKDRAQIQLDHKAANIKRINPDKDVYGDIIPMIRQMDKYERQLQKLAEHNCNGYPMNKVEYTDGRMFSYAVEDVAWRERCEKRESKIGKAVIDLATEFNLQPDFQGDPRGLMFRLLDKDGKEVA